MVPFKFTHLFDFTLISRNLFFNNSEILSETEPNVHVPNLLFKLNKR